MAKPACLPSFCCISNKMSLVSSLSKNVVLWLLVMVVPISIKLSVDTMVSMVLLV